MCPIWGQVCGIYIIYQLFLERIWVQYTTSQMLEAHVNFSLYVLSPSEYLDLDSHWESNIFIMSII